jgi:glycosyltransferase involved in cell wall biosynthesis
MMDKAPAPAVTCGHTVIMPVYNGERYLEEAIASVLAQDCADLELLVVDDCSTDDSAAILKQFACVDPRVRLAATPLNSGGPATPKNLGLALARGAFISFCDQDDVLLPHKLERATRVFREHPGIDLVFSDFRPFGASSHDGGSYLAAKNFMHRAASYLAPLGPDIHLCTRFWGCMAGIDTGITTQTVVCRRELLRGCRFDSRFRIVDDIAMWSRLAEAGRIAFIDQPVALYRHHAGALTSDGSLLARESIAFHHENYFRQRHLFNPGEDRRYRQMLARLFVRCASLPRLSKLERRSYLLQAVGFHVRPVYLRWLLQTLGA